MTLVLIHGNTIVLKVLYIPFVQWECIFPGILSASANGHVPILEYAQRI